MGVSELFFQKKSEKKHLSQAQFVSRFAIVIPCVVYHWKILNWLLPSLTFTNILANIDAPRWCPNSHNSTKNDSKRKENVVKGSRGLLTAQNSLKVLRIESIVPRFLLIPALHFPSQMCSKSRVSLPNLEYRSIYNLIYISWSDLRSCRKPRRSKL